MPDFKSPDLVEDHRQPTEIIKDLLHQADKGIPRKGLELYADGEKIAKQKSFKPQEVLTAINHIADEFGQTEEGKQVILGKFVTILDVAVGRFDFKSRDRVDYGLLDNVLSKFPNKLQAALQGKTNGADLLSVILDIGVSSIGSIAFDSQTARMFPNYEITRVFKSLTNLTDYVEGGEFDENREKQKLLHRLFNGSRQDISEVTKMLLETKTARESFDNRGSAVRNLGEFVLTVFESDPNLLKYLETKSVTALAEASKNLKEASLGDGLSLIRESGQMIAGLRSTDEYASHIFCQKAFTSLQGEAKERNYGVVEARRFLEKAVEFVHSANASKSQQKDTYGYMRDFLEEGYLGILLSVDDPNFIQQVIDSADGKGEARSRLNRIMTGLDMAEAVRLAAAAVGKPINTTEEIEFYQQVVAQKQPVYLPVRAVRHSLTKRLAAGSLPENFQLVDLRQPLMAVVRSCQGLNYEDLKVISFGLDTAVNEKLIDLTLSEIGQLQLEDFVSFIKGLGVLRNSWFDLKIFEGKQMSDFLEIPETDEGKTGFIKALTNLANIYFSSQDKSQRQQIHQLVAYALEHDELRTAFLLHLHANTDFRTLNSLAWITRLADSDDQLGASVRGFLGQRMEGFALPKGKQLSTGSLAETAIVPFTNDGNVALEKIVDNAQPLGAAIQVISEAVGHNPEVMHSVAEALGKVKLRTVEDAQSIAMPIIGAISRFLGVDKNVLLENMFSFRKVSELVQKLGEMDSIVGTIGTIFSITGGGPIPVLAFSSKENAILINEEYARGWTVDGLGEEIAHWVRDTIHPNEEDNPIVHEFWGFLGRRIARAALGIEDAKVSLADFEEAIDGSIKQILDRERYGYLDIGFGPQFRSLIIHAVGYITASNIDLFNLPPNLINADDQVILNQFIEKFGPNTKWYKSLVNKIRFEHAAALKTGRITQKRTPIDKLLGPVFEALEFTPFIANERAIRKAQGSLSQSNQSNRKLSSGEE